MNDMLTAQELSDATITLGVYKTGKSSGKVFLSAILAGMFIALGYVGYLSITGLFENTNIGRIVGALAFPIGLMLILIAGADLFTSNVLIHMALFKKKISVGKVLKNLGIVWLGNLTGSLIFVFLIYFSGLFSSVNNEGLYHYTTHLGEYKVHLGIGEMFFRAILCNFLVAGTAYMTYASRSVPGKVLCTILPIWVFVLTGFEHVVANMFVIPITYLLSDHITLGQVFYNLIPVTIGNLVGGIIIAGAYYVLSTHKSEVRI
ncbi:MAG: formate/nitrite transporter family protein [Turicibacter sp.]|nr:formate/nitrite transporter family protein [Turicibacter sp.]